MNPTIDVWKGASPVFFLEINWNGQIYRPSTQPLTISSANGFKILQGGMLQDPDFTENLPELGFNVNSFSTSFAVYLQNINIAKQNQQQNKLDGAQAELSYILVKQGISQTYEQRTVLLRGVVKEPVFAHPDRSKSYVEFSVETEVLELSFHNLAVGSSARISAKDLSDLTNSSLSPLSSILNSNNFIEVLELHRGKILPIIFGAAGEGFDIDNNVIYYPATPAYVIYATHGAGNQIWLALAPHDVEAERVRIYDDLGNFRTENVEKWIRRDGRIFSFVHFTHGTGSFQNPVDDESARFFVSWFDGGGLISPSTNSAITGGGDICLYCLSQGDQQVDFAAWESLRPLLNQYKFSGYITNTEVSPLEFLENEIIPFLPIAVIQGLDGMKPIIDVYCQGARPFASFTVIASEEFTLQGGLQRIGDVSSLCNEYTLEYSFDIKHNELRNRMTVTGDSSQVRETVSSNMQAQSSFNQYGSRKMIETSNFITDFSTAALVCFDKIRQKSLPNEFAEYVAAPRFGYMQTGDIILLTDEKLDFVERLAQVVTKRWVGENWIYRVKIGNLEVS